ncbi:hypothetical protein GCM10022406_25780 [Hymenobacter algoricola]|uniref:Uncharacterized protein n=1 Tax=Hymenobacter algoricola TaxID=486267 RepID=A0ABP7NCQ7_9BACT
MPSAIRQAAELVQQPEFLPVRQQEVEQVADALMESLSSAAFLLGHNNTLADPLDLNLMSTEVAVMIRRNFPGLRLPEIHLAIRRGVAGDWRRENDLLLLTLPNIAYWLGCYQTHCRAVALEILERERGRLLALPPPDPTVGFPERVTEWAVQLSQRQPLEWQRLDIGDVVYLWLQRIGAFRPYLTPRRQQRILRTVGWQLATHRSIDKQQRKDTREFREQLRTGELTGPHAVRLRDACRKHMLREWLHYQAADTPVSDLHLWLEDLAENASRQ